MIYSNMQQKTVLGVLYDPDEAQGTIADLEIRGYDPRDVSIIMRDQQRASKISGDTGATVAGGAVSGAATGAIIGGLAGLLGAFIIPGLGAFLIGGPIAAAFGLTGAAASTVSGVATGAVAGGLIGALTGLGLTKDEAAIYEKRVKDGGVLLIVPAFENDEEEVMRILSNHGADNVRVTSRTVNQNLGANSSREIVTKDISQEGELLASDLSDSNADKADEYVNPIQVEKFLKDVDYPVGKDRLIEVAKQEGADQRVIFTLESLRGGMFKDPTGVSRAVGQLGHKGGESKSKSKKRVP